MFYLIEAVTERGARGHYRYAAKLFRLCTYLNVEVDRESLGSTEHFGAKFIIFRAKKTMSIGVSKQAVCRCLRSCELLRPLWSLE